MPLQGLLICAVRQDGTALIITAEHAPPDEFKDSSDSWAPVVNATLGLFGGRLTVARQRREVRPWRPTPTISSRRRRSTRAVAMAATPSPRPVRPRPSVVVAETVTGRADGGRERGLRLGAARAEPRAVADHLDGDVADLEARPRGRGRRSRRAGRRPTRRPTPGPTCRSCEPRSPSPAAESSASQAAWAATSPSE